MSQAGKTIFPTIPTIIASQPGTIIAAIQTLTQCVNLLIIDAQATDIPGHLSGSKVLTPTSVNNQTSINVNNQIATLRVSIEKLNKAVKQLGGQL